MGLLDIVNGITGNDPNDNTNALMRFGTSLQSPDVQAAQLQLETQKNALAALAKMREQGVNNPQQILNSLASIDPQYAEKAAQLQSQNPLASLIQGSGNGAGNTANENAPSIDTLTGDDLLKALPPAIASQVKGISEGKIQLPGGLGGKGQALRQQLLQLVTQYDPGFDAVNYNKRAQTAKSFAPGGKDRQNINSIETALNTLSLLHDTNDKLGGVDNLSILTTPANVIRNKTLSASSDNDLARYNKLAKDAADEVTKAIVSNGGTGADRDTRFKALSADQSPSARKAVIQASVDELMQRLNPVAESFNSGMGVTKNGIQLLTPQAQKSYTKVMGTAPELTMATGDQTQDVSTNSSENSSQIKEGVTATNPKTGEKVVFKDGKWQPL